MPLGVPWEKSLIFERYPKGSMEIDLSGHDFLPPEYWIAGAMAFLDVERKRELRGKTLAAFSRRPGRSWTFLRGPWNRRERRESAFRQEPVE
jgi:hypothetical protein